MNIFQLAILAVAVWGVYSWYKQGQAQQRRIVCRFCRAAGTVQRVHTISNRTGRNVYDLKCSNCGCSERRADL